KAINNAENRDIAAETGYHFKPFELMPIDFIGCWLGKVFRRHLDVALTIEPSLFAVIQVANMGNKAFIHYPELIYVELSPTVGKLHPPVLVIKTIFFRHRLGLDFQPPLDTVNGGNFSCDHPLFRNIASFPRSHRNYHRSKLWPGLLSGSCRSLATRFL